ncbi:MAG: hypothetical protein HONBIEJF_00838 [Fimbriimonadaceae bacterium]|nr:hypothetical protein [Fimbriimonadaceae bacterium]
MIVNKSLSKLQKKKAMEAIQTARLEEALAKFRQQQRAEITSVKRPDSALLLRYVSVKSLDGLLIRSPEDFRSSTYNRSRRLQQFVDHLFVRYPTPDFLYRSVLTPEGWAVFRPDAPAIRKPAGWEREAFFAAAQGTSVANVMRDRLTRKETHWFLQAPATNSAQQNVVWAKFVGSGVPIPLANTLLRRFGTRDVQKEIGHRMDEIARFYARESAGMSDMTLSTITDYICAACRDPSFSLSGRTLGSVIELSRLWHATDVTGGRIPLVTWSPFLPLWERDLGDATVRAVELTSNRALAEEGRKQRHCVFTYASYCRSGATAIASIRWIVYDDREAPKIIKRLTVELDRKRREIHQVRGFCNRMPDNDERKVLRQWTGDNDLTIVQI